MVMVAPFKLYFCFCNFAPCRQLWSVIFMSGIFMSSIFMSGIFMSGIFMSCNFMSSNFSQPVVIVGLVVEMVYSRHKLQKAYHIDNISVSLCFFRTDTIQRASMWPCIKFRTVVIFCLHPRTTTHTSSSSSSGGL